MIISSVWGIFMHCSAAYVPIFIYLSNLQHLLHDQIGVIISSVARSTGFLFNYRGDPREDTGGKFLLMNVFVYFLAFRAMAGSFSLGFK